MKHLNPVGPNNTNAVNTIESVSVNHTRSEQYIQIRLTMKNIPCSTYETIINTKFIF